MPNAVPTFTRSRPRGCVRKLATSFSASVMSERMRWLRWKYASPSGVSARRRVVRLRSRTPSRSSSRVTSFEIAEGVSPKSRAAVEKPPSSTERTKAVMSLGALIVSVLS